MNSTPIQSDSLPQTAPTSQAIAATANPSPQQANAAWGLKPTLSVAPLKSSRKARRYLSNHGLGESYSCAIMVGRHVLAEVEDYPQEWDLYLTYSRGAEAADTATVPSDLPAEQLRAYLEAWALPIIASDIEEQAAEAAAAKQHELGEVAAQFSRDTQVLAAEAVRTRLDARTKRRAATRVPLLVNIPVKLYMRLLTMDKKCIGTARYMGIAFFWSYEYRHSLRDISFTRRQLVHDALLRAGLDLAGVSPEHLAIIQRYAEQ